MVLLRDINDNIIIPHLYYSSVYQYEAKMRALTRDKYFLGRNQNKRNDKREVHISLSTFGFLSAHCVGDCDKVVWGNGAKEYPNGGIHNVTYNAVILDKGERSWAVRSSAGITSAVWTRSPDLTRSIF